MQDEFHDALIATLPRLQAFARMLTHDGEAAEDLVQDTVERALRARDSFVLGTNLRAWLLRIMHNRFLSLVRMNGNRQILTIDDAPEESFARGARHENRLLLKELRRGLLRLPPGPREKLLMVALQGMSYEDVAAATGCALGTAKSQVSRARDQLRIWLLDAGTTGRRVPSFGLREKPVRGHGVSGSRLSGP